VREWVAFEAVIDHKVVNGATVTSAGFRLSDGTTDYFWNGVAWEVAGTGQWNTESEVNVGISRFPVEGKALQVVVNLVTNEDSVTPELEEVRVVYGAVMDSEIEDMVVRSFLPALREGLQSVAEFPVLLASPASSLNLVLGNATSDNDFRLETEYRVIDVDGVFNHTDDPDHLRSLYYSHTTRTSTNPRLDGTVDSVVLSEAMAAGKVLWLRLLIEPEVIVLTGRDYYELEHVPSVVIERVNFRGLGLAGEESVGNRSSGDAFVVSRPQQGPLDLSLRGIADKLTDHFRLSDAFNRFLARNPELISTGLDERYTLRLVADYDYRPTPNAEDLHNWTRTVRVEHFRVWGGDVSNDKLVKRVAVTYALAT
jgi:hypothetical protein